MSEKDSSTDWTQWSREAVESMMQKNSQWPAEFGLLGSPGCRWDLDSATLTLEGGLHDVVATVCLVGTTSESQGSFLWSWANDAIPAQHGQALQVVRDFGEKHGLGLLTTPQVAGARPEATECLCIAGRLQHALGTFVDQQSDVTLYFTLLHLQVVDASQRLLH
ncbi:DUF6882 domain-containing protein [Comamonas composti]|uniref:DUF6882 domain-containing protein n=1 Tax=Comamonas composti TaxID=408558 RepID=UPI000409DC27|nr:DUF6882 domain-containing protein [Comamonas composti]